MKEARVTGRADELRRAFDHSFAAPLAERRDDVESLLALRLAGVSYALRLVEIASVAVDRKIVPVPSSAKAVLGLSGFRGQIAPVYDLRILLGHPPASEPPRWIALAKGVLVGFAFDELVGYLQLPRARIVPAGEALHQEHLPEVIRTLEVVHPLISLASVIESIRQENR